MIKVGKKPQWYGLALAIAPALIVFGLVYAADVYYNLDTSRIVFNETATTTFAGSIAQPSGNLIIGSATGNLLLNPYGGKVGVASSTPSDQFAVQGNIIGSGNLTVYGASTSTIAHGLIVDTSTLYVVAGSNNIGIGTTTPTGRLDIEDIAGSPQLAPMTFIYRPNNLVAGNQTPSNAELRIKGHSANYKLYVEDQEANPLFAITGSGNVGVATTTPRYKLDVWGDIGFGTSTDTNTPALYVDSGNGGRVGIGTTTLAGLLTVGTSTSRFVVSPVGYVGVASSTPSETFAVQGNMLGMGNIVISGTVNTGQGATEVYLMDQAVQTTNNVTFATVDTGQGANELYAMNQNVRTTDSPTFGNLTLTFGISSATGTYTGLITATGGIISQASSTFTADLTVNSAQYPLGASLFIDASEGRVGIGTTTLAGLLTVGTSTPYLVVDPAGKTGIASSTPSAQLAVQGNIIGSGNMVVYGTTATSTFTGGLTAGNNAALVVNQAATANTLYITTNGRAGVGTADPHYIFNVKGTSSGAAQTVALFSISDAEETGLFIQPDGTANQELVRLIAAGYSAQATDLVLSASLSSGTNEDIMTLKSGGSTAGAFKVGIATSTPRYKLDVWGDIGFGTSTSAGTGQVPALFVDSGDGGRVGIGTTTLAGLLTVGTSTPAFVVDPTGKTGIASSTPSAQLAVQGNIIGSGNIVLYGTGAAATSTFVGIEASAFKMTGGTPAANKVLTSDANGYATWVTASASGGSNWQFIGPNAIRPTSTVGIIVNASSTFAGDLTVGNEDLFIDVSENKVGIASSTPSETFAVQGNIIGSGNLVIYGTAATSTIAHGLTVDTNTLYVMADTGKVGIGTASPQTKLNIAGSSAALGSPQLSITGSGLSNYMTLGFGYLTGYANVAAELGFQNMNDGGGTYGDLLFATRNSGNDIAPTERMRVTSAGLVGIATTTPRYTLDVYGDFAVGTTTGTGAHYPLLFVDSGAGGTANGVGIGTTTVSGTMLTVGTSTPAFVVSQNGNVGIGTTTPAHPLVVNSAATSAFVVNSSGQVGIGTAGPNNKLDVASETRTGTHPTGLAIYGTTGCSDGTGYSGCAEFRHTNASQGIGFGYNTIYATANPTDGYNNQNLNLIARGNAPLTLQAYGSVTGNVGVATTTPGNVLTINSAASNALTVTAEGNLGIGMATTSTRLTMASGGRRGDFAIGDFNAEIIDDMEAVGDWTSWASSTVLTVAETSIVKVGSGSLQVYASSTPEDMVAVKTYASNQDWSAFERLGFWVYADRFATSSATTTQLISVGIHGNIDNVTSTHQITFQSENKWQYEEWNIDTVLGVTTTDRIFFRVDFNNLGTINFYIDQLRLYDDTERTGEIFVDNDGVLAVLGRGGVEIGRADGSSNKPGLKVDTAIVEINQPLSVDVGGDVGFDYDLQFLSTGLSQITSEGPLRIAGGDTNHGENLTLTVGGTGDIIVELANASSTFMVTQGTNASTTAFIINSETTATSTAGYLGAIFQIITDVSSDENVVFSVDAGGSVRYDMSAISPASDVAENYKVIDESIEPSDVVCLSSSNLTVEKCSNDYQDKLIGVISTRPALWMGGDLESSRPVALTGRVPVKVSLENGSIAVGDPLTSASSTPGVAMKATRAGKIFGYALEAYAGAIETESPAGDSVSTTSDSVSTTSVVAGGATGGATESPAGDSVATDPVATTILAFIHLDELGGDLTVSQNETGNLVVSSYTQSGQQQLFSIDETGALVVEKIKTQELCVGSVCVTEADFMRVFGASLTGDAGGDATESPAGDSVATTTTDSVATTSDAVSGATESPAGDSVATDSVATTQNGANRPCSSEVGACQIGVQIYQDGVWGDCIGAVFPTDEIMDEVDNDCDGQTDEGLVGGETESPAGDSVSTTSVAAGGDATESPAGDSVATTTTDQVASTTEPVIETATSTTP